MCATFVAIDAAAAARTWARPCGVRSLVGHAKTLSMSVQTAVIPRGRSTVGYLELRVLQILERSQRIIMLVFANRWSRAVPILLYPDKATIATPQASGSGWTC